MSFTRENIRLFLLIPVLKGINYELETEVKNINFSLCQYMQV